MLISDLELLKLSQLPKLNVIFTSGLNVIVGDNGVGKTNVGRSDSSLCVR